MIRKQFLVYSLAAGCTTQPRICTHQTLQKDSANTIFVHDAFMYTNCKELHSSSRHANQKKEKDGECDVYYQVSFSTGCFSDSVGVVIPDTIP